MPRDPRQDAYIEAQPEFAKPILTWLRERIHAACPEIEETMRWSRPSYSYKGQLLCGLSGFKAHAAFGFWHQDAVGTGKGSEAMGDFGRIASLDDLPDATAMEAMIRHAAALIDEGTRPARAPRAPKPEAEVPPELAEALAEDDVAAETFRNFPPGQRREYCDWIAEAKRAETKAKRVAEAVEWLREGKRRNWKYESC